MKKVLYVLSIGVVNILSGKTMYDWSIYDHPTPEHTPNMYLTDRGSLLYSSGGIEVGDEIELRGNDSQRLLGHCKVVDVSRSVKEELLVMLKRNNYDYYPLRAFQSRPRGNRKLMTSYSVK